MKIVISRSIPFRLSVLEQYLFESKLQNEQLYLYVYNRERKCWYLENPYSIEFKSDKFYKYIITSYNFGYCTGSIDEKLDSTQFSYEEFRKHDELINIVENSKNSDLKVVNIPDDLDYYIDSSDDIEIVRQKHLKFY